MSKYVIDIREVTYNYFLKRRTSKCIPEGWEKLSVLEIGAGLENYGTVFEKGDYVAVDLEEKVRERVPRFVQADIHALPFKDKSFDKFIAVSILEHTEKPVQALSELRRVCRLGGLVSVPTLDAFPFVYDPVNWIMKKIGKPVVNFGIGGFGHVSMYYERQWEKMFDRAGFSITDVEGSSISLFTAVEFLICSLVLSKGEYVEVTETTNNRMNEGLGVCSGMVMQIVKRMLEPAHGMLNRIDSKLPGYSGYRFYLGPGEIGVESRIFRKKGGHIA